MCYIRRLFAHKIFPIRKVWVKDLLLATVPRARARAVGLCCILSTSLEAFLCNHKKIMFPSLFPLVSTKAAHWVHLLALFCLFSP